MYNDRQKFLNIFSTNLKVQRRNRGYSQERLSELAGISYKYYQELESGKKVPSVIILLSICNALDVNMEKLVEPDINMRSEKGSR